MFSTGQKASKGLKATSDTPPDLLQVVQLVIQPKTQTTAAASKGRYRCCAPISAPDLLLMTPTDQEQYMRTCRHAMEAMEEWGQVDDRVIKRSYICEVCISCAWFTYGIDAHCHTCIGCALMQALLEQGQHLTHGCRHWKPVHHVETVPAVAA